MYGRRRVFLSWCDRISIEQFCTLWGASRRKGISLVCLKLMVFLSVGLSGITLDIVCL